MIIHIKQYDYSYKTEMRNFNGLFYTNSQLIKSFVTLGSITIKSFSCKIDICIKHLTLLD